MKKDYLKKILLSFIIVFGLTGCFKKDSLDDVDIYTTVYPIAYVTDYLYGDHANVYSIYPAETKLDTYKPTKDQKKQYSSGAVFVYNGLTDEKKIARDLLNMNNDLRIIDVSQGLDFDKSTLELWMNPNDFLMLSHNVKDGLKEYISNKYIKEEIDKKYEELKVLISEYDAELEIAVAASSDKEIVIASSELSYLKKYGFEITDLDKDSSQNSVDKIKNLRAAGKIKYIYMLDTDEKSETVKQLEASGLEVKKIRSMTIRTEEEVKKDIKYDNMMRDNVDAIKAEVVN